MKTIIFIFAASAVAFAQEGSSHEDTLKTLTSEGFKKIDETLTNINNAPEDFGNMIVGRINCLIGECNAQKEATNKSVTDAVFKGMLKNKQFKNFQCVSNAAKETFEKLNAVEEKLPENSKAIKEKKLAEVMPFRLVLDKLSLYVQDLYKTKKEELKNATTDDARKKILAEVMQKMKLLETVLDAMNGQLKNTKFKFFEEFVDYVFASENNIKKIQREGNSKILNCVA